MTKDEHIKYWIESAEHDIDTMSALFKSAKYDWALFVGHLVLEKIIKAIFVQNNDNKIPPKIHNLVRLAELSYISLDSEMKIKFDKINDFNLEVRYPSYKNEFYKMCTKEFTEMNINNIQKLYRWLKSQIT